MNENLISSIVKVLSIQKDKRSIEENQIICDFIQIHPLNDKYKFRADSMMQISMNAQIEIFSKNNEISQKFYIILKGQVGIYFPKNVKHKYEDLRQSNSNEVQKYTVSDYLNKLWKISVKDKDSWFGEIGLVNNGNMHQVAISETDVQVIVIEKSCYEKYIQDKEIILIKKKLKIFQNSLFTDCSPSSQRILYYMSNKKSFNIKQTLLSENDVIENIYIIKKGEFSIYKQIYDEDSMTEQINNPNNQNTNAQLQLRKQNKENKKYSKNTKLKVIQRNEVVGEHDAILKRTSRYSCVCEGYDGGVVQVIPVFLFLYIIELDKPFKTSLNEKLKQKMVDFNDRVLQISQQMQKFGQFFFFKSRKPQEENTLIKQNQVFDIDNKTQKVRKINVSEIYKNESQDQEEIKEIQQLANKLQEENQKDGEDFNDFSYFPINQYTHQKLNIQKTMPISSKDIENDLLSQSSQYKQKQQFTKNQDSFSQRQSFSNLPNNIDQNSSFGSRITPLQIKDSNKLKTQKSLQENSLFSRYLESDYLSVSNRKYSSQRDIPFFYDEESNKNNSNEEEYNQSISSQLNHGLKDETFSNSFEDSLQQSQEVKRIFRRSQSRKTMIINDDHLIEEENHQISQSSDDSVVSPISIKKKQFNRMNSNLAAIELENGNKQDSFLQKQNSPLQLKIGFRRKQKKSFTQTQSQYQNRNGIFNEDYQENEQNFYKDEDKSQEQIEFQTTSNKVRRQLSQNGNYQKDQMSNQSNKNIFSSNKSGFGFSSYSKRESSSRVMDMLFDDLQNGQSNNQKQNLSLNNKITDKLLLKAVVDTQNLKNEILKEKDFVQVKDLKSRNKNELKSLMEIKNLQIKMNQKQDPTKYDELLKTSQMRVLDLNIKLNQQKNKKQLEEERERKVNEQNNINEQQKEEIIRKHISKIGLVSPSNSIQLNKNQLMSPSNSLESLQLSGAMSTGRNVLRNMQLKQMEKKPLLSDLLSNIKSPLNKNPNKNKESSINTSQKLSQFNFSVATQVSSNNFDAVLMQNQQYESSQQVSPHNQQKNCNESEDTNSQAATTRSSYINYNQLTFSTPQNNKSNNQRKITQQSLFSDPLNIGNKQNLKAATPQGRIEQSLSFSDDEYTNTPSTQTHQQTKERKQKIHFKSSVDEYIEVKAKALSNNFDKKKIKSKDLPLLDSYASQLQINLKRLFYVKLKENYCKETGFENVQNRVADQILDQNFKQFLQKNKDILPEKQETNYLYNWRNQSQKKSMVDKYQQQLSSSQQQSISQIQQDFLKDNIPATGFLAKKAKLPNIQKQKYSSTDSSVILTNPSSYNIRSSHTLEKQIQTAPKQELLNSGGQIAKKEQQSNIFQNQGRQKFISERTLQFTQNMSNINKQQEKEQRNLKAMETIDIKQATKIAHSSQKIIPPQNKTLINIDLYKKLSYKEFQDIYEHDQQKIEDFEEKARNDLINLNKFFNTNQKADEALKNDKELIKKLSQLDIISQQQNQSSKQQKFKNFKKQCTLDTSNFEEEYIQTQQDEYFEEEQEDEEENEKYRNTQINLKNKYISNLGSQFKKGLQFSPSSKNMLPKQKNQQQKMVTMKSVEEEMKELTQSIIQKYGLQSKFKNKNFK